MPMLGDQGGAREGISGPGLCRDLCLNTLPWAQTVLQRKANSYLLGASAGCGIEGLQSQVLGAAPPEEEAVPLCSRQ